MAAIAFYKFIHTIAKFWYQMQKCLIAQWLAIDQGAVEIKYQTLHELLYLITRQALSE